MPDAPRNAARFDAEPTAARQGRFKKPSCRARRLAHCDAQVRTAFFTPSMTNNSRGLDLHALECLDMLIRQGSVSRAAERLGMSQSSTSEMLARLREHFGDPLLVRGREGMVPTPQALVLLPRLRRTLEEMRALLDEGRSFDPAAASMRFRITTSDYTQLLLMPRLTQRLRLEAPSCALDVLPIHLLRVAEALDSGELDLALAYYPDPPPALRRAPLFSDRYVCIARPGHPARLGTLSAEEFAALSHISVSPSGLSYFSSVVDSALEAQGLTRRVAVSSPHFLLAAHLVSQSDMVLALPSQAAAQLAEFMPIACFEIPLQMRAVEVAMYWHERTNQSKAHQWLRDRVRDALAAHT